MSITLCKFFSVVREFGCKLSLHPAIKKCIYQNTKNYVKSGSYSKRGKSATTTYTIRIQEVDVPSPTLIRDMSMLLRPGLREMSVRASLISCLQISFLLSRWTTNTSIEVNIRTTLPQVSLSHLTTTPMHALVS